MSTDILKLRDYQKECIADFRRRTLAGGIRIPSVLATGLGKTVIFSHLAAQWEGMRSLIETSTSLRAGKRILVLAHTDELILQAAKKIKNTAPHLSVGIVKAERNEVSARVIVASVQSLRSERRRAMIRDVGLIIVDECHHATAPTYRRILEHYGALATPEQSIVWAQCNECLAEDEDPRAWCDCGGRTEIYGECAPPCCARAHEPEKCPKRTGAFVPRCIVAGFTATLARGDDAKLSEVWEANTFKRGISFGIRRGYLLDVRGHRIVVPNLDLTKVKKSGGDYQDSSLADALEESYAPEIIAEKYAELAVDRKGLVFWPTVAAAEHGAKAFTDAGIPSAVVHGKLAREERRSLLRKLASGETKVVHNCAVLTEGFDDPTISCVVIARPTRSAPLYQQMVGRGLRPDLSLPASERGDCLVLDVVGASRSHDLRSLVDLSEADIREEIAEEEQLSLVELEDLEAEALERDQETVPEDLYTGTTAAIDFDPLGRTTIGAWLRTDNGVYFLPAGKELYVLLVPSEDPGMWDVAWLTQHAAMLRDGVPGATTEHRGLSLEMACSWAEEVMEDFGGSMLGSKKKRWRSNPPTDAQVFKARRLGITIPQDASKGDVADLITERFGSNRIDPIISMMINERR